MVVLSFSLLIIFWKVAYEINVTQFTKRLFVFVLSFLSLRYFMIKQYWKSFSSVIAVVNCASLKRENVFSILNERKEKVAIDVRKVDISSLREAEIKLNRKKHIVIYMYPFWNITWSLLFTHKILYFVWCWVKYWKQLATCPEKTDMVSETDYSICTAIGWDHNYCNQRCWKIYQLVKWLGCSLCI